jgi:predicted GNAT superfamily acetyltransferase
MYGTTRSALHGALPTDRFIAAWRCDTVTELPEPPSPEARNAPLLNPVSNGTPSLGTVADAAHLRVQIPTDVQPIFQQQPALASRWRDVTRRAFTDRLAAGYRISGFVRGTSQALPFYILTRSAR